ncbi:acyltransferase [Pseudaeromonas sharmana]|uniref:Acyltransferase n=1 Tax=Pseudaeromonas sharmana TaxID=328412 RepID=A0ABV8CKR5_9GAMM
MLTLLIPCVRGCCSLLLILVNTLFWFLPILLLSCVKLLPIHACRRRCNQLLNGCANGWIGNNNLIQRLLRLGRLNVVGVDNLSKKEWYMVIANHQSWVDILVLQRVFHRRIPFLKFFLKKELIWVPFLGIAWWALDFPFMRRYSTRFLQKHPHLRGKDIETTRRACEKYRQIPVSIMNFVEGTRFSDHKQRHQQSPFRHLLKPRAGGLAFTLGAMRDHLHHLLDVTICYPKGVPTFWDFICGKVREIHVKIEQLPINEQLKGDYFNNASFQHGFQQWLNDRWQAKDRQLDEWLTRDTS